MLNLGRYERQAYLNVAGRLTGKKKEQALARKEQEFRDSDSESVSRRAAAGRRLFPRQDRRALVVVGPINLPVGRLFVEEVITECRKRGATRVDVLAFEFEMGLSPPCWTRPNKGHRPRAQDHPARGVRQTGRRERPGPLP